MACPKCSYIGGSYSGKPFHGGGADTYICHYCGQRWWCYNTHFCLWTTVGDERTFKNIQRGCPEPVAISSPAINLDVAEQLRKETWDGNEHITKDVLGIYARDSGKLHILQQRAIREHLICCGKCREIILGSR